HPCAGVLTYVLFLFFFSSRRRHTRCYRDWSSDVCSSDLDPLRRAGGHLACRVRALWSRLWSSLSGSAPAPPPAGTGGRAAWQRRSEERRVGKEWRSGGAG